MEDNCNFSFTPGLTENFGCSLQTAQRLSRDVIFFKTEQITVSATKALYFNPFPKFKEYNLTLGQTKYSTQSMKVKVTTNE